MIKNKKIIFVLLALIFLGSLTAFFILIGRKPSLKIITKPDDAVILVDEKERGEGQVSLRLDKGKHQIRVVKEGYDSYSQEINLTKDTTETVVLNTPAKQIPPESVGATKISPYSAGYFQPIAKDTLIALDRETSYLIKIKNSSTEVLYAKPVYNYSFADPYVALIEKGNLNKIALVNVVNKEVTEFDVKDFSPVISLSLDPDAKNLYFLGNYNPLIRTSKLYVTALDNFASQEIGSLSADSLQVLPDNKIVFSLSADAADLSEFSIYDVKTKKYLSQSKGSGYLVSPSFENIAVYSTKIVTVVSLRDYSKKTFPYSFDNQKLAWEDLSNLIVLTNTYPGVEMSILDTQTSTSTSTTKVPGLSQVSVRLVLGLIEKTLYLQDAEGKIWSINLP